MRNLNRSPAAPGFTLIEVLIGVLVLALGLLGLGAIIPVVIRQQRQSVDVTLGNEALNAAKKILLGRPDLDPATPFNFNAANQPVPTIGWDVWLMGTPNWSLNPPANAYCWEPLRSSASPPSGNINIDLTTGEFGWHTTGTNQVDCTISLADRLWPAESAQGEMVLRPGTDPYRPQFVWDFVARRVQTRAGEPQQLQVALFVRRIDLNIRIPRGTHGAPAQPYTLRDVLLHRAFLPNASDARVPVSSDPKAGPLQYLPTNDGILPGLTLRYSMPVFVDAQFDPADTQRIEFPNLTRADNAWKLISQAGQRIVDNLGNIYTVRGIADELEPGNPGMPTEVIVDPAVPAYVADPNTAPANSPGLLRQVVFTPQIPAAVDVFTITRTVPSP